MCSPLLPSWIRWHAFSYSFLDAEGTTRKTERRKWLTPHQKISLSPAFNMGTMFKMQVTSLLKTANILSQMANKLPKTKWNWIVPTPGPITILPIYCPGGKKNREESLATHTVGGLVSTGFLPLIMGKSISIHGKLCRKPLFYLHSLHPCASF